VEFILNKRIQLLSGNSYAKNLLFFNFMLSNQIGKAKLTIEDLLKSEPDREFVKFAGRIFNNHAVKGCNNIAWIVVFAKNKLRACKGNTENSLNQSLYDLKFLTVRR
jgi:hypothetical protein